MLIDSEHARGTGADRPGEADADARRLPVESAYPANFGTAVAIGTSPFRRRGHHHRLPVAQRTMDTHRDSWRFSTIFRAGFGRRVTSLKTADICQTRQCGRIEKRLERVRQLPYEVSTPPP